MQERDIVYIEWIDSCSYMGGGEWIDLQQAENLEPVFCRTVGFIIQDIEQFVTVAAHMNQVQSNGDVTLSGDICIPRCCIKKMYSLSKKD